MSNLRGRPWSLIVFAAGVGACGAEDTQWVGSASAGGSDDTSSTSTLPGGGDDGSTTESMPGVGSTSSAEGAGGVVTGMSPDATGGAAGAPGNEDTPGAGGGDGVVGADDPPGAAVFADGQLLEVRLTIAPADLTALDEHGNDEEYVPAAVELASAGGTPVALPEIGVRHKGNWTLHNCWDSNGGVRSYEGECAKLSLKLKFDEYDTSSRFDGLKRINLHSSTGESTRLRELLAYRTFREFGVDAPRAIPARVYINDEPRGIYIAVEDVDGRYTAAHYPDGPNGNLYKEIWPNASFTDDEFRAALETNEEAGEVSDMRAFAEAVTASTPGTFSGDVEPFLDLEALLRYIAVDRALRNWDGIMSFYTARSPHNFFWYHDDGAEPRFHLIPWDMNDSYWPFDPYSHPEGPVTAPPIPDFNVRPLHCEPRPIWVADGSGGYMTPGRCDVLLNAIAENYWDRIVELGHELLAGPFAAAQQHAWVAEWATMVAPIVAEDPVLDPSAWEESVAIFHDLLDAAGPGFEAFLAEGLRDEEAAPADESAEADASEDAGDGDEVAPE